MQERTATIWGCTVMLTLTGVAVGLGFVSATPLVGGLAFAGTVVLIIAASSYLNGKNFWSYLLVTLLGIVLLGAGVWTSRLAGQWLWAPLWLVGAMLSFLVGYEAGKEGEPGKRATSYAVCAALLIAGLALPGPLYPPISGGGSFSAMDMWVWISFILGFTSLAGAWWQGYLNEEARPYLLLSLAGIGLLAAGTWLSGFAGGWWLLVPWAIAALAIAHGATDLPRYESGWKTTGFVLAGLCLLLGAAGPLLPSLLERAHAPATSEVDQAATQLAAAQNTATQAAEAAVGATATSLASTALAEQEAIARAATERAEQTAAVPTATRSAEQEAATQLAEAIGTATAAAGAAAPAPPPTSTSAAPAAAAPSGAQPANPGGLAGLWQFSLSAVKSIWGIFHLIVLFSLGQLWLKRWGGLFAIVLLFGAAYYAGAFNSGLLADMQHAISSSPARWMRDLAELSAGRFGSPGWGILIAGAAASAAVFPALRITALANRAMADLPEGQRIPGSAAAVAAMQRRGVDPIQSSLASVVVMTLSVGLPIALWVGLRQLADSGFAGPFGFLGVPDLSVPNFKPVWLGPYFVLAGVLGLAQILLTRLQLRFNLLPPGMSACLNPLIVLVGAVGAALMAPAGVLLFQVGQSLAQTLLLPLVAFRLAPQRRPAWRPPTPPPTPTPPAPRLDPTPRPAPPEPRPVVDSTPPAPHPTPTPSLNSSLEYRLPATAVHLAVNDNGDVWIIDAESRLTLIRPDKNRAFNLKMDRPAALLPLKDNHLLAVADDGRLIRLRLDEQMVMEGELQTSIPVKAFDLNPFRTMLAYLDPKARQVKGMWIESSKETEFAADLGLSAALAFSKSGRELAAGSPTGEVNVIDIATREVSHQFWQNIFVTGPYKPRAVERILALPGGGWLVFYEENILARWSAEGKVVRHIALPSTPTCTATDSDGLLAVGSRSGYVRIYDLDLEETFKDKVQATRVNLLAFSCDGRGLYSIGNDNQLRRTRL